LKWTGIAILGGEKVEKKKSKKRRKNGGTGESLAKVELALFSREEGGKMQNALGTGRRKIDGKT